MTAGGGAGGGSGRRLPLDWYPIDPIHLAATAISAPFIARGGRLYGWAFEESTGAAPAQFVVVDGASAGGTTIAAITLLANESTRDIWGKPGIRVRSGVYLSMISGSIRGTIFYLTLSEEEIYERALREAAGVN